MKQIDHAQMSQVTGGGLVGDLLGGLGNTLDGLLKPIVGGLTLALASVAATLVGLLK